MASATSSSLHCSGGMRDSILALVGFGVSSCADKEAISSIACSGDRFPSPVIVIDSSPSDRLRMRVLGIISSPGAVGSNGKAAKATGNPYAAIPAVLFELAATGIERGSAIRKNKLLEGQQEFAWEQQQKRNNSYLNPNSVYFQGDKGYMGGTVVT